MTRAMPKPLTLTPKQQKWRRLLSKLEERCLQPIDEFRKLGSVVETINGPLIHIDRGSKILGVAHLDTVAKQIPKSVIWQTQNRRSLPVINSIQLDDRLGVWMLLDLLPAMGLEFDVLLCDGEERGRSTAEHFKPGREYNWGFEFDRAGVDTVLYNYDDDDTWRTALKKSGFDIQCGSFSDISSLTHVGCCFANFGVGYHYQHRPECYASLDDTVLMALEFEHWYKAQKDTAYKFTPTDHGFGRYYSGGWSRSNSYTWKKTYSNSWRRDEPDDDDACIECPLCHKPVTLPTGSRDSKLLQCPWCKEKSTAKQFRAAHATRVDTLPRCNWCGARAWDDRGVCDVCGYDPQIDRPLDNELMIECPICGGDMDEDYCCYCGYVEENGK